MNWFETPEEYLGMTCDIDAIICEFAFGKKDDSTKDDWQRALNVEIKGKHVKSLTYAKGVRDAKDNNATEAKDDVTEAKDDVTEAKDDVTTMYSLYTQAVEAGHQSIVDWVEAADKKREVWMPILEETVHYDCAHCCCNNCQISSLGRFRHGTRLPIWGESKNRYKCQCVKMSCIIPFVGSPGKNTFFIKHMNGDKDDSSLDNLRVCYED